jgi:hypothetical protein
MTTPIAPCFCMNEDGLELIGMLVSMYVLTLDKAILRFTYMPKRVILIASLPTFSQVKYNAYFLKEYELKYNLGLAFYDLKA